MIVPRPRARRCLPRAAADDRARRRRSRIARSRPRCAPRVSGELNDEVWQPRHAGRRLRQREPHEGGEPSQRTEFRVAYDATHALREGSRLRHRRRTRSSPTSRAAICDSPCDWIRILIDSYHDKRTAYEFAVNPSGVKLDRYWFNDNNRDDSWDAVWDVSVSRDRARLDAPSSAFRSRSCASTRRRSSTFGFAVSRADRPPERNRRPGRCSRAARTAMCRRSASSAA